MMAVLNTAVAAATNTDTDPPIATPVKRRTVLTQGQAGSAHGVAKLRTRNEMQRIAVTRCFSHVPAKFDAGLV